MAVIPLSRHATRRADQRGIRADQIDAVIEHGRLISRAGGDWFLLHRDDLSPEELRDDVVARSIGVVVLVEGGVVSTVYHHDRPLRHVLRKARFSRKRCENGGRWAKAA